jgi:hypothetical protein
VIEVVMEKTLYEERCYCDRSRYGEEMSLYKNSI